MISGMSYLVQEILDFSKDSSLKKYIYGAGELANLIYRWLNAHGGTVDSFLIDDEFYNECNPINQKGDIPIIQPLSILKNYDSKYRLIIGFEGDYLKGLKKAAVSKEFVLAADFLGYFATGEENASFAEYYEKNRDEFAQIRTLFYDEKSRLVFDDFIEQKISGTYEKDYDKTLQYFDDEIIGTRLSSGELFVDCGAFKGETALEFSDYLNRLGIERYDGIIEFEPDRKNIECLKNNLSKMDNIEIVEAGVYDRTTRLSFLSEKGSASRLDSDGKDYVDVVSLDEYVGVDREVTFIKMDIEGSELMALHGAMGIIKKYHPKLAICVYHKYEDLVEIPKYIKYLDDDYSLYLRSYSRCGVETVLYAV